ncbi:hypothetical protein [Burkholderia cepacia]|uniref:hypothetical protein n=1 Tax=Burkholderia cepacia TaxID=292 RepID=UPI000F594929|nr:hypothetical protein [Burkholderia cepacia]
MRSLNASAAGVVPTCSAEVVGSATKATVAERNSGPPLTNDKVEPGCVLLCIAERTAPADLWPIRIADADSAAQVRHAAEQKEIDRLAIGSKRVAAWGREHDNEKQARSVQKRVDKLKEDRTVAAMSGGKRARLLFPARSTASDHPR